MSLINGDNSRRPGYQGPQRQCVSILPLIALSDRPENFKNSLRDFDKSLGSNKSDRSVGLKTKRYKSSEIIKESLKK